MVPTLEKLGWSPERRSEVQKHLVLAAKEFHWGSCCGLHLLLHCPGRFSRTTPFELIAQKLGFRLLQSARDMFPRYQGLVGATRRSWAAANGETLVNFIPAYLESLAWLHDDANKAAAAAILVEKVPKMSPDLAAATYKELLKLSGGFEPKVKIDVEGMKAVLALRSEYGRPQKTLTDPMKYVDLSYYEQATR